MIREFEYLMCVHLTEKYNHGDDYVIWKGKVVDLVKKAGFSFLRVRLAVSTVFGEFGVKLSSFELQRS